MRQESRHVRTTCRPTKIESTSRPHTARDLIPIIILFPSLPRSAGGTQKYKISNSRPLQGRKFSLIRTLHFTVPILIELEPVKIPISLFLLRWPPKWNSPSASGNELGMAETSIICQARDLIIKWENAGEEKPGVLSDPWRNNNNSLCERSGTWDHQKAKIFSLIKRKRAQLGGFLFSI